MKNNISFYFQKKIREMLMLEEFNDSAHETVTYGLESDLDDSSSLETDFVFS